MMKISGLDFGDYIEYVMERIQAGETDARSLLPNHIIIPQDWVPEGQIDRPIEEKIALNPKIVIKADAQSVEKQRHGKIIAYARRSNAEGKNA